jgi:DMSO/TMAO reductase YedYZ molybdopterin-dependent catalytic subunit
MNDVMKPRRRFLARSAAAASGLLVAGCDRLSQTSWFPRVLGVAEKWNAATAHAITPRKAMAQEFADSDRSPTFRSNGTAEPNSAAYQALATGGFADYRMEVGGLVAKPATYSLAELRALPSRTQITRHDCVEGWSAIGKWKGVPLSTILMTARLKPEARYIVFHCADDLENVFQLFPRLKERRKQNAGTLSGGQRKLLPAGPPNQAARQGASTSAGARAGLAGARRSRPGVCRWILALPA